MVRYTGLSPILWTEKLDETIQFYTTILGFHCNERNDDWGWASLQKDEIGIMIAKPNAHSHFTQPIFTGSLYINTDEIDQLWISLQDQVNIVYPIESFEWNMREFAIYDNNGYIIQFGQDISTLAASSSFTTNE